MTPNAVHRRLKQHAPLPASEPDTDPVHFTGRALLFVGLCLWGWRFVTMPLESNYAGESVLHLVNLPFHEAGHVFFSPLGRFLMVLGGTLGQLLMPLVCVATFLIKTRDAFAAAVALWWTGESLLDIAPYINDARALELTLLGGVTGQEVEGHDWEYLLSTLGWLSYDHRLAALTQGTGRLVMIGALLWAGTVLRQQYRRLPARSRRS